MRFVLRALGFDDILLSRFQNEGRYFSIFPSGFNEMPNEKEGTRSDERKRFLFLFFGGKDLFVVLPKSTQT